MLRKLLPLVLFVAAGISLYVYFQTRVPPGYETKGAEDWTPIVSLVSTIVTTASGVVTMVLQVLQHRRG